MTDRHGSTLLDSPLKVKKLTKLYGQFLDVSVEDFLVYCREIQNSSEMKLCLTGILMIPTDLPNCIYFRPAARYSYLE